MITVFWALPRSLSVTDERGLSLLKTPVCCILVPSFLLIGIMEDLVIAILVLIYGILPGHQKLLVLLLWTTNPGPMIALTIDWLFTIILHDANSSFESALLAP